MRKDKPYVMTNLKRGTGVPDIVDWIHTALQSHAATPIP
jgi:Ni2+-binding GTPase involved in maturation of urease and hydrogenase